MASVVELAGGVKIIINSCSLRMRQLTPDPGIQDVHVQQWIASDIHAYHTQKSLNAFYTTLSVGSRREYLTFNALKFLPSEIRSAELSING